MSDIVSSLMDQTVMLPFLYRRANVGVPADTDCSMTKGMYPFICVRLPQLLNLASL